MTDFNRPMTSEEFKQITEYADRFIELQETVMLSQYALVNHTMGGERGEMVADMQKYWSEISAKFISDVDIIVNSLSEEHDTHLKRVQQRDAYRKAARLGLKET